MTLSVANRWSCQGFIPTETVGTILLGPILLYTQVFEARHFGMDCRNPASKDSELGATTDATCNRKHETTGWRYLNRKRSLPLPLSWSAVILAAISAGETPALPGG